MVNVHYPNKHFWVSEGIATLVSASRGRALKWYIQGTNLY
ncbi:hypothetical protein THALO_270003 [Tenacibaculum halocynthiae]